MLAAMRIAMPDRTGMLAAVTAVVSETGGDIVTIEVVHRDAHQVVDDLCIELGSAAPMELRRRVEAISGVVVESLHAVDQSPSPAAALELGIALVEARTTGTVLACLVDGLPKALLATWAVVLAQPDTNPMPARPHPALPAATVLAVTDGAPATGRSMAVPWMPLDRPRRLIPGPWMPATWQVRAAVSGLELAAAPVGDDSTVAVVLVRSSGLRFRPPELRQLHLLASATASRSDPTTATAGGSLPAEAQPPAPS